MSVPLSVLIIEDSEDDALLLIEELVNAGYDAAWERVETSTQTRAALNKKWDIVLSDYRLPSFTGMDALQLVRGVDPDIPFIIVSGQISEETAVVAMKAGAQDFVLKDNLARLVPAIERELREATVRRERRLAEEALRRSEMILQSIMDSSSAAIYLKDAEGRFIVVNKQSARILGLSKDDAIGRTDRTLLPEESSGINEEHDQEVMDTCAPREYEETIEAEDGIHHYVSAKFPVYDGTGHVYGVGGISTDITELVRFRREVEEALERERHFSLLLQRALLPSMPDIGEGYAVGAEYVAAYAGREIGGDFYDVFRVEDCLAGVMIGDVSGKGLEAAALAATTRSTVHAFVHQTASPAEALKLANSVLHSLQQGFTGFVTVFLILLDLCTGEIRFAGAGHPPGIICRLDGAIEYLREGQMPLAILDEQEFAEHNNYLGHGDKLLLYTDGISEARRGVDLFEQEGIERTMRENHPQPAAAMAKTLLNTATEWANGQLRDDAAVVVIERL